MMVKKTVLQRGAAWLCVLTMSCSWAVPAVKAEELTAEEDVQSIVSEELFSAEAASEEGLPEELFSEETMTEETLPEETVLEEAAPEELPEEEELVLESEMTGLAFLEEQTFSVQAADASGNLSELYLPEGGGKGYLFPAEGEAAEVTLITTGVVSTSAGTLDPETGRITDAFTAAGDSVILTDKDGAEHELVLSLTAQKAFSGYVTDSQGCRIQLFYQNADGNFYLFLTAKENIPEVSLYVSGAVVQASKGTLDIASGCLTGAFEAAGDRITLTDRNGLAYNIVVLQSDLPSLYIDLGETDLEEVHQDKEIKYPGNKVVLTDPSGEFDLSAEGVEFKGRGNSSWVYFEKKGYQIKFDKKTSVFGLGKAKKWVLLANSCDDSMIRNKLAFDLAGQMAELPAPKGNYVDLWISGEYRGTYLLSEKVEIGTSRIVLENELGGLFEQDNEFYQWEDYYFKDLWGNAYTVKETVNEDEASIRKIMEHFETEINELETYLYTTSVEKISMEKIRSIIDVDSFAAYYLLNEYLLNRESIASSFYFYQDGPDDVIHLGPVWDYDTSMGNDLGGEGTDSYYVYQNVFFDKLLRVPEFARIVESLREKYRSQFSGVGAKAGELAARLEKSAGMNYLRWDVLGKENAKTVFAPTYQEAAGNLQNWLTQRESVFSIDGFTGQDVHFVINKEKGTIQLSYKLDETKGSSVCFVVWSAKNNEDDQTRYTAAQGDGNVFTAEAEIGELNAPGIVWIAVEYEANGRWNTDAYSKLYIDSIPQPSITRELAKDNSSVLVVIKNARSYRNVQLSFWRDTESESSAIGIVATRQENGDWVCTIPLKKYKDAGLCHIRVYGTRKDRMITMGDMEIYVDEPPTAERRIYRLYNPYTQEHLLCSDFAELNALLFAGWTLDGIAWNAPEEGTAVYRLYNPFDDWHTYSVSLEEIDSLTKLGWTVDGDVSRSADPEIGTAVYRLFNPYVQVNYHMFTASVEERDFLVSLGWVLEGVAWYCL